MPFETGVGQVGADGSYQYTMTVSEDYTSSGAPAVVRGYSGFVNVDNLDNSPYGSGWSLHNVDRLLPQASGVTLVQGGGNMVWFAEQQAQGGMPGGPTFTTPAGE